MRPPRSNQQPVRQFLTMRSGYPPGKRGVPHLIREMMARPVQWPFAEMTLQDVLSSEPGSKFQQQGSGSSLVDAARSARATVQQAAVHQVDSVPTWGRGSAVAYCVGLVAIAATLTVTMALCPGSSAQAATRPTAWTDDQATMVQPTKLNPALPFAEQEIGMRADAPAHAAKPRLVDRRAAGRRYPNKRRSQGRQSCRRDAGR